MISIYERPGGNILDGVLYSNRTSGSDERYRGFGTKDVLLWAAELTADGGWIPEWESVRPEDGINPDGSTGTRSICRFEGADTDTRQDWYIVPTLQASFGARNSEEVYVP